MPERVQSYKACGHERVLWAMQSAGAHHQQGAMARWAAAAARPCASGPGQALVRGMSSGPGVLAPGGARWELRLQGTLFSSVCPACCSCCLQCLVDPPFVQHQSVTDEGILGTGQRQQDRQASQQLLHTNRCPSRGA